ncbi:MAG: hypothetical protein M3N19_04635 [Candidatus Eremiobacteraeota bacterium]|nr:hypothetical protein [Candidatus Eremiobacteraeota bacterium]
MKKSRFIESRSYGRFKFFNSVLFIGFGLLIIFQMARGIGLRIEALSGYVLGLALITLGIFRLKAFIRGPGV